MSCSSIYVCESTEPHINKCSDGFILYLEDTGWVHVYIKLWGGGTICRTVQVVLGAIKVPFRPADYNFDKIQIELKDVQGNSIAIPYGSGSQCGIEVQVLDSCESGYIVLNPAFATTNTCSWSIPTYSCSWELSTYSCSWSLTNIYMINQVVYGHSTINLTSAPAIRDGVSVIVNPDFEAELEAIEAGAFTASLVVDEVVVTYIGSQSVEFLDNGVEVDKTCV